MRPISLLLGLVAVLAMAAPAAANPRNTDQTVGAGLAAVRSATARYLDPAAAVADGYAPTDECVEIPGVGAMGYHYINFGLFDATVELTRPEALLYIPSPSGPRLVGVEWVAADVGQPHPSVLSVPFDGPMDGHGPGMPVHYDLHAWIWQANPEGVFAQFNPGLSC